MEERIFSIVSGTEVVQILGTSMAERDSTISIYGTDRVAALISSGIIVVDGDINQQNDDDDEEESKSMSDVIIGSDETIDSGMIQLELERYREGRYTFKQLAKKVSIIVNSYLK